MQAKSQWGGNGAYHESEAEAALLALENAKRRRGYFMEPQQLPLFP